MESSNLDTLRLEQATEKVKKIKSFYTHLLIYVIINMIIVFINIQNLEVGESYFQLRNFITFGVWGIVIIIHALSVFLPNFIFGSQWEARKIKKYMEQEEKYQQWD